MMPATMKRKPAVVAERVWASTVDRAKAIAVGGWQGDGGERATPTFLLEGKPARLEGQGEKTPNAVFVFFCVFLCEVFLSCL